MNKLITLFILVSVAAFGQAPEKKPTLAFSPYEKGEMAEFELAKTQLIKIFRSQDSLQGVFLQKFLTRNGVDLTRVSNHKDSLTIKPEGIEYILKPKKK